MFNCVALVVILQTNSKRCQLVSTDDMVSRKGVNQDFQLGTKSTEQNYLCIHLTQKIYLYSTDLYNSHTGKIFIVH